MSQASADDAHGLATGEITDHVYDGIQEYDNPLPGWWTLLFYGTILFSFGYAFIALARPEWTDVNLEYDAALVKKKEREFALLGELQPDHETLMSFLDGGEKSEFLGNGAALFATNCASCHGKDGGGNAGPNMTDDAYLNVTKLEDIPQVVINGANGAAMPAWGGRLSMNEVVLVSAYVASLRGQDVGGKAPEGEVIPPWGDAGE
jgi:cytochrome c oxidase cbb3-type subunit 3